MTFARDVLDVVTADNLSWTFHVDLAVTPAQRSHGLMFRKTMADDEGMLFLYTREAPRSFWMKNTYLPLDIIFLDRHGVIVSIAADARPLDETTIPSGAPAAGVLEVLAGTSRRLGLEPGDRVIHRAFDPSVRGPMAPPADIATPENT